MPRPVVPMAFAPCAFSRAVRTDAQALEHRHALPDQHFGLFEKSIERQHHAVADQALHVRVQDSGRNQ